jgi:glycosyltransferase involved in cell wall biosynthesis
MMVNKICCIFNLAARYREPIYKLMDEKLGCDFYITKWKTPPFKEMDYNRLNGYKYSGKKINLFFGFYWQTKTIHLIFKPYKQYIITGEPFSLSNWIILLSAKIKRKEVYLWSHGWYGRESKTKKVLKYWFFNLATKTFLYGNYARELMLKEGFSPNKLECIYNSLDYEKQVQVRNTLKVSNIYCNHFKNDAPTIIYIGRIQIIKKINLVLKALSVLRSNNYLCNLIIVGSDDEGVNLHELAYKLNIEDSVWFYGACYDERKIGELIYNSALCVSPGNVGLTAMHSLVFGTPVLTHDNFVNQMPEFEAIEADKTGGFFKEGSIVDLCKKIKKYTSDLPQEREIIRKHCYKIIDEKYNPYYQLSILEKTFKI